MADERDSEAADSTRLPKPLRTVTPPSRTHPNEVMDVIGWGVALGLALVLAPMLPFVVIVWAISKVVERVAS